MFVPNLAHYVSLFRFDTVFAGRFSVHEADFARGDYDKARQGYIQAILLDPKNYGAALFLGDVYFKQGKLKDAIAQWQNSLKEWETTPPSEHDPVEVAKVQRKLEGAKVRQAKESSSSANKQP